MRRPCVALRAKEARQAAAEREAEKEAALQQATLAWQKEQAELAAELGISLADWRRIYSLLSAPPAKRINSHLVLCGAAMGRAMVVHTALQEIVAEPLRESGPSALTRAGRE